jgi:hypothetical protein
MFIAILPKIILETIFDILLFPFWWYTKGAWRALVYCFGLLKYGNELMNPGLWLKNIFVPMFGQYDIQGRIISFLMRCAQIVARTIGLFFWLIICLVLFAVWLSLPLAVIWGLYNVYK